MTTRKLSKGMLKALEGIKETSKTFGGASTIKVKATKNKTLRAVFPVLGKLDFNLYINNKFLESYFFNGQNWKKL